MQYITCSISHIHVYYITSLSGENRTEWIYDLSNVAVFSLCELRFFKDRDLSLPDVVKPLVDVDFVTIATDSLTQCLQPLVIVGSFKSVKFAVFFFFVIVFVYLSLAPPRPLCSPALPRTTSSQ